MPRFDGTGPLGKGPGTGRGLGKCKENDQKDDGVFTRGRGFGLLFGRGRNMWRGFRWNRR